MDVRVTGDSYADVAEKYKEKDGLKVIVVRPCHQPEKDDA
jgi:cytochrome c551/c552